jgi:Family of unknown function (DUF6940)
MFNASLEKNEFGQVTKYWLTRSGQSMTYSDVIEGWANHGAFRSFFTSLLQDSPYKAYRWETPVLSLQTCRRPFEFVLVNTPGFATRATDVHSYRAYFNDRPDGSDIVTFQNLGGDATLVVPTPLTSRDIYGHLAGFVRYGPASQVNSLWQAVGHILHVGVQPIWLNTAGGGVAWLHIRIDSRPKYYSYTPYKAAL